jgi:hypothetical protein
MSQLLWPRTIIVLNEIISNVCNWRNAREKQVEAFLKIRNYYLTLNQAKSPITNSIRFQTQILSLILKQYNNNNLEVNFYKQN